LRRRAPSTGGLLGLPAKGRSSPDWVDFDFYGHQIVAHLAPEEAGHKNTNAVDGDNVPVRHFGAILPMGEWERLAAKLKAAGQEFIIEPHVRFEGGGRRAGDDVLPRPLRQRARVQGIQGHPAGCSRSSGPPLGAEEPARG